MLIKLLRDRLIDGKEVPKGETINVSPRLAATLCEARCARMVPQIVLRAPPKPGKKTRARGKTRARKRG